MVAKGEKIVLQFSPEAKAIFPEILDTYRSPESPQKSIDKNPFDLNAPDTLGEQSIPVENNSLHI